MRNSYKIVFLAEHISWASKVFQKLLDWIQKKSHKNKCAFKTLFITKNRSCSVIYFGVRGAVAK